MQSGSWADWVSGLGSLAAVIVAMLGYWVVERHRAADRRDSERGIAHELAATLAEMANNIFAIDKHMRTQRNDITVRATGREDIQFRVINPLIGLSSEGELRLPQGSTELLIKADAVALWNDANLLAAHNRALTSVMIEYRSVWERAMAKMPAPFDFTGQIGHISAEQDAFTNVRPELIKIDSIVQALESQVTEAVQLTNEVAGAFGPAMKKYFRGAFLHLGPGPAADAEKEKPTA